MKKDYLLAAILCLITTAAAAQQTEQVQIPNIPLASKWLYDNNGDGKLEFINPETKYVSNDKYNHSLKTFNRTGEELSSYTFPFTQRIDDNDLASKMIIGFGNYAGDDNPDIFLKSYYSTNEYATYLFTGNTNGSFSEKKIKSPAYTGDQYGNGTENEMPFLVLDANADGRPDLYGYNSTTKQHYFLIAQPNGEYMRRTIQVLTDEEEIDNAIIAKDDAPVVASVGLKLSGVSLAKVMRRQLMKAQGVLSSAAADIAWSENVSAIDLNMDGYPDLIDNTNGGALISIDEGVYYFGTFKGIPTARDLNGDGIPDFILFDTKTKTVTLQLYTGEGGYKSQTLMQNMNISNVYCYDFDGDGDVDILLPFDYTDNSQYAFLVFFQNNGDNTFTKKERSFAEKLYFKDCRDVDNDGVYEVIAVLTDASGNSVVSGANNKLYRIKCNASSGWSVVKDTEPFVDYVEWKSYYTTPPDAELVKWVAADMDNSGKTDFYTLQHNNGGTLNLLGTFDAVKTNNAPAKMTAPTFIADAAAQALRIEWKSGNDDLTAVPDLTYALRIGTEPGKGDVLYAAANADGSRRRAGEGENGSALFRLMRTGGWSAGKYYIAVQAVDAHGRGGAWSPEAVYTHTQLSSGFNIPKTKTTTADTLAVALQAPFNDTFTYTWNFGEGSEIISNENGTCKVVYNSAGEKTISLQVADSKDNKSVLTEKRIEVYAVKFEANKLGLGYKNYFYYFDADMNGKLDAVSGTNYSNLPEFKVFGLLEGDGIGNFTKVGRTYNSDLQPKYIHFVDMNMDGLPDFTGTTNKGNVFINGDDFDFEFSTETFTALNSSGKNIFEDRYFSWENIKWMDFNGDGSPDIISSNYDNGGIFLNSGDNRNFTLLTIPGRYDDENQYLDFNNDGLMDVYNQTSWTNNSWTPSKSLLLNDGNNGFIRKELPLSTPFRPIILDFNNDGWLDMVNLNTETKTLSFYLGDASLDYTAPPVEIKLPVKEEYLSDRYFIHDMDNNGYPDLVFYIGILYFYPNMETRWQAIADTHLGNLQAIPDNESNGFYPFADLNGDGTPDTKAYNILSRIKNTAPQAPQNARASQTDEGILLEWDAAVDTETPVTQMRYNVSVKEKGKSGAGSFILSPMNGLKNSAAAIPDYHGYRKATRITLPLSRFQAGKTYQLQVQAIDLWNEHSPFSTVYEFTVESQVTIRMPQSACMGKSVAVSYAGTETGVVTWHWDGGEAVAAGTNSWNVLWNTPGLKNVQVTVGGKTVDRPLKVRKNVDMAFSLPTTVLAKCEIPFTLPDLFNDPTKKVYIRTSDNMQVVTAENVSGMNVIAPSDVNKITVKRRAGSLDAVVIFPKNATQWIELVYNDESCGELVYRQTTDVVGQNLTPQIALVTVDAGTGKTKINWTTPTDLDISIFNKIEIYKEMGSTNNFVKIDEVPLTAEMYIDQSSDPLVRKSRYRIALGTTFGGRSQMSETHCNVHVMINKGLGNAINLIWTKYEGALINSYSILRGTSPENMQIITTASGYENSFTDINAPEDAYYALSYSSSYSDKWISLEQQAMSPQYVKGTTANTISGSSNTVTTNQSVAVTFAQSLFIQSIEKNIQLTSDQPVLHLYAEILPAMATYKRVNWKITEGADLAIISESGLLTYIGRGSNGTITVKATAIDGSGISAQRTITVGGFVQTSIEEAAEAHAARNYTLYPNPAKDELRIENGEIQINRLEILDLSGKVVCQYDDSKNKINISALSRGIYFVKIETDNGVVTRKFIKE
jgi:hypothetical protein